MYRFVLAMGVLVALGACQPAAAPAAETPQPEATAELPETPVETAAWDVDLSPVLTLTSAEQGISLTCEVAKGVLRLSFEPAWELEGPFDKAIVHFGDKSFPVAIDPASAKDTSDKYRPVYVLPADADTVTAVMLANNVRLVMTNHDGEQERKGSPTDNGAFDLFGTTCAQINGLR